MDVDALHEHPDLGPALRWAYEAGAFLMQRPARIATDTKSSDTDLVTEMDKGSEALLVAAISQHFPADGIVGEEGADRAGTSGRRWVLDPLDGTVNYFYRLPAWAVSIGLQDAKGNGLVGVVHAPALDLTFVAIADHGSFQIARGTAHRLAVSDASTLGHALVATGFGYSANRRAGQAQVLAHLAPRVRDIRRAGSAALDLCWLAAGAVDAYYERGVHLWDWAAGALVAREAGALVGNLRGGQPDEQMLVAAGPGIFHELRDLLASLDAGTDPAET